MTTQSVLILHGWKVPVERYKSVRKLLEKKGFNVHLPSLPGFGNNKELTKPLTLNDYVEFIYKYLKKNNITKPTIIGHSFGGRVAIKLACAYPNTVKNLVLSGTPGLLPVSNIKLKFFWLLAKIGNLIFTLPLLSNYSNFARKILYRLASASDYLRTKGNMRETFKSVIRQDLEDCIKKIRIPVILIWGEIDKHVPLEIAKKMKKLFYSSQLIIIKKADHNFPYKQPADFVERILSYI